MANTIPCPNPACTHDFNQAELQSASELLCPKCGFRMQGRGAAAKPAALASKPAPAAPVVRRAAPTPLPPTKPVAAPARPATPVAKPAPVVQAKPVAAVPPMATPMMASPVIAAPLFAEAVASAPAPVDNPPLATPLPAPEAAAEGDAFFDPGVVAHTNTLVHAGTRTKKPFNWYRLMLVFLALGFATTIVIVAVTCVYWLMRETGALRPNSAVEGSVYNGNINNEKVYQLTLAKSDWSVDKEVQTKFGAHAAWKRNGQDFWFAVVVKDYTTTKPRDAEMLRIAIEKLENYFGESLELDTKAIAAKVGEAPAQKLRFKGQILAANWLGECYMVFHNGIVYWLYVASPNWETVETLGADFLANNFITVSERRGWREQPAPKETFTSISNKVTMSAPKGVWEKHNAKDEDENGELLLSGRFQREKANRKNALVLVFTLEKKDDLKDAVKAARDYLDKTKADNNGYKFLPASEGSKEQTELGSLETIGNRRGRVIDLKLQFNDEAQRYYLVAVVSDPDICYVIACNCAWESRQIWRQEFLDLMGSINIKKGE